MCKKRKAGSEKLLLIGLAVLQGFQKCRRKGNLEMNRDMWYVSLNYGIHICKIS